MSIQSLPGKAPGRACPHALALSVLLASVGLAAEPLPELPLEPPAVTAAAPAEVAPAPAAKTWKAPEITVTATRIARDGETVDLSRDASVVTSVNRLVESSARSGAAFTVITGETMENKLDRTLADVLAGQAGVIVSPTGGSHNPTSIMIRGAGSAETSVLLDGVRLNNPMISGGSGMFDLSSIAPMNLSQVTVLRGSNSVLYGSDALGGAVDMQLRKGQGCPTGSFASEFGAAGEHLLFRERVQSQGGNEHFNYSLAAQYQGTGGSRSSLIPDGTPGSNEAEGYWGEGFNGRFGITPTKNIELSLTTLWEFGHSRFDTQSFPGTMFDGPADDDAYNEYSTLLVRPKLWVSAMDGLWDNELGFAYLEQRQLSHNYSATDFGFGPMGSDSFSHVDGRSFIGDWKSTLALPKYSTTTVGVDLRVDTGENYGYTEDDFGGKVFNDDITRSSITSVDVYFQEQLRFFEDDRWVTNFGARIANNEKFGTYTTWHVDSVFHVFETGTSLRASGGTGFKAPTLYQLYGPDMTALMWVYTPNGNPDLKPETSLGFDVGVTQSLFDGRNVTNATFFYNHYSDLIVFGYTNPALWEGGQFRNVDSAVTKGVELSNATRLFTGECGWFNRADFTVNYTYLDSRGYGDSDPLAYNKILARRPNHMLGMDLNFKLLNERLNLNTELIYYGSCWSDAQNTRPIDGAWLWNMGASMQATDHLRVYGKLNNLLRQNYCRADGYQSDGFGGFAGVEISF